MKKEQIKNFIGYTLAGALTVGASVIPTLIYSGLTFQHVGVYAYLLPVVLLIVMEKSFIFLLQGFGKITNPSKILVASLIVSILGTIISMVGYIYMPLWSVGAVLIGIGMSIYAPMFRTYRDKKRKNKTWESNSAITSSYFMLVIILAIVFILRHQHFNIVMSIYLITQLLTLIFMNDKLRKSPDKDKPMFDRGDKNENTIITTAVIMLATLAVCFYKETADTRYAFWTLTAYSIFFIFFALLHKTKYKDYAKRTFWYGAMRTFLNTFGLIYFSATGQHEYVFTVYIMYGLGIGLSKIIGKPLKKLVGASSYEKVCITLAILSSCLLLTFSPILMLVGILLGVMFVSAGNTNSAYIYLEDTLYPFNERHLIRTKFFATGAVMSQGMTMTIMLIITGLMRIGGGSPLWAYLYTDGSNVYKPIFVWTLLLSILILTVAIIISQKKKTSKNKS